MDGSLLFGTKLDTSGIRSGLSSIGGIASSALGLTTKAVAAVSAGLSAGAAASVKFGSQFETSLAKASTLFGDVAVDTENLNQKILEMSSSSGTAASELNETLYSAMSAGIPVTEDMSEAIAAVDTANKLSIGGYTSASTAMGALTTAINAYKLPASDAARIADELITVQNKGVTTVDELASNMGKAIATGSAYSINLENINAGYISLTKSGISTAESTTYMASMFNELGDSGSTVGEIIQKKTGMSFAELMASGGSLADAMDILSESVDGDSSALINLWGSAEAGKAANAICQQGTDAFRQSLDDLANSAGMTETAYNTMMDTFEGKKSILIESAKNLGIAIYEGIQAQAGGMLDVANEYISQLQTGFEENGSDGLIQAFGNIISDLVGRAADFAPQIIELAIQIVGQLGRALVDNAPEILESVQTIIDTVLESVGELIPGVSPLTDFLQDALSPLIDFLQDIINNFDELVPYIEAATVAFLVFKAGMEISSLIFGITSAVKGMIAAYSAAAAAEEGLTVAQWLLNTAMNANVISIIVIALAALVAAFIYLWNTSDSFREFWINLWNEICDFFTNAWDSIVSFFAETIPNLISNIGTWFSELPEKIGTWLTEVVNKIIAWGSEMLTASGQAVSDVISGVVDFFAQLPEKISYWLGFALGKVIVWAIQLPVKATEAASKFLTNVIAYISTLPERLWEWLVNTVIKVAAWQIQMSVKATEAASKFLTNVIQYIRTLPEKFWDWLVKTAVKVVLWRKDLIEKGKDAIEGMKNAIIEAAKSLPEKMLEIGANIVNGVWNGIVAAKNQFMANVKSFFAGIVDGAKTELDIHSPSKKFAWIGKMCVTGLDQELENYNPYNTLERTMKAGKAVMRMNYIVGAESRNGGFDYSRFGKETAAALERAGLTISVEKRPFGRLVREVIV